ncbi:MAG: hypothetical protein QM730_18010 [Anaerolineales bacterium]
MEYYTKPMKPLRRSFFVVIILLAMGVQGCGMPKTPIPSSSETTPTASPASFPFEENLSCWPIASLESSNDIKGSILFENMSRDGKLFAWDVSSFHTHKLDYSSLAYTVSSDGSLVAFLLFNQNKLILISSTQTKEFTLPEGNDYVDVQFASNGLIYIGGTRDEFSSNYTDTGFFDKYYLLDTGTGNLTDKTVFLPNFTLGPRVYRFPIEYSPDLQYIVYKTTPSDDGNYKFALMNVKTGEIIWTGYSMPHWKPDGKVLTYFSRNLFSLSKDGTSSQMTHFEQKILAGLGTLGEDMPWSSDGRYLAFHETQTALSLFYIWDNQEKVAFRPCLPDELRAYSNYHAYWSPDSKFLLLRLVYPDTRYSGEMPTPTHFLDLILDMRNQTIYTLPSDDNRGQFLSQAPDGAIIEGWVNWELQ